jgi:predicted acetyltransferase
MRLSRAGLSRRKINAVSERESVIDVVPATAEHRAVLRSLFELYAHDLSAMTAADVDAQGHYTPDAFLRGWWDAHADAFHPFLVRVDGHWAGFAFVEVGSYVAGDDHTHWLMEEFFIVRKYRKRGIGAHFAAHLLRRFSGVWEIGQLPQNSAATAFWRHVLTDVVKQPFIEHLVDNEHWAGPVQVVTMS